jgi:DNA adenine methylase
MAILTPFRYPGAKNKILPLIIEKLSEIIEDDFFDVFVGGGSVLLEVAKKYPKINLYANDKDYWIYCFWKTIISNNEKFEELLDLISQKPTLNLFYLLRNEKYNDYVRCAYKAIFFNRTAFSGILKSGPIGGREQKSKYKINCRYNQKELRSKLINCRRLLKDRLILFNEDFDNLNILKENLPAYLDPPYVLAGKSLYYHYMTKEEHIKLRNILNNRNNWVLSYDNDEFIKKIYNKNKIIVVDGNYSIKGKKKNWSKKTELIITS